MPRYIDADALLKKQTTIRVTYHCQGADEWDDYKAVLVKDIKEAPTISPDEVRGVGEWERAEYEDNKFWANYCSLCYSYLPYGLEWKPNYCPHCGAKMEVSEDA